MSSAISALYAQVGSSRKFVLQALVASILTVAVRVPVPLLLRFMVDRVVPAGESRLLVVAVLLQFALMVAGILLTNVTGVFQTLVGARLSVGIGTRFFDRLSSLSMGFFDGARTGDLVGRFAESQNAVNSGAAIFNEFALAAVQAAVFPIVLAWIDWRLTLIALAVYPLDIYVFQVMNRAVYRRSKKKVETLAELRSRLVEYIGGMRTVQALDCRDAACSDILDHATRTAHADYRLALARHSGNSVSGVLRAMGQTAFLLFGWNEVLQGNMSLGSLLAFNLYLGYLVGPISSLFGVSTKLQNTLVQAGRFLEVYDAVPEVRDPGRPERLPAVAKSTIRFENVSFAYGNGRRVLDGVTLTIPAGGTTAIVGRSGAGKSTLVNLIPRFYDPSSGRVTIGGRDLRSFRIADLRGAMSFVLQDGSYFWGTVIEYLSFGNGRLDPTRVMDVLDRVGLGEWTRELPDGIDTPIGECGARLSGGQRQKLALARACLHPRPIAILDEPTSAVDYIGGNEMTRLVEECLERSTVIVIAHRLATIRRADQIVVLEEGGIAETGVFDDLMQRDGAFMDLFNAMTRI